VEFVHGGLSPEARDYTHRHNPATQAGGLPGAASQATLACVFALKDSQQC